MSIYTRVRDFFGGPPETEPVTVPEEVEEKAINFDTVIAGVDDGKIYYTYLNNDKTPYSTNYVINKCINILAYNLSRLPLRIVKGDEPLPLGTPLPGGFNILYPHPRMSLSRLLYECGLYYWYKGEFMSYIDLETLLTLEPVDPGQMKINTTEGGMITSWAHRISKLTIPDEQLIYAAMLNPETIKTNSDDKHRALALVNVVKKEILNYAAARDFNVQFFNNYAQLGLTLTDVDARVSLEDRRAIVNEIDNKLGKGKAWKTRFLPQGTDIANTKDLNMREMEFGQSLKDIRDIILGVFGVPRSVFGITNEAGLAQSTVEVEKRIMWTDTIQPASYMIQEAFNQTLMKTYFPGYKVIFDYSNIDVLQDNMMDKTDLALKYQSLGYTTNEVNDMLDLGMEESDDARMNERFHSNMLLPYSGFELEEEPAKQVDEKIVKIVEILEEEEQKTVGARKYRNKYNRVLRKNEKRMVSKLGRYFAEQLGKVLAVVKQEKAQKDISETLLLTEILNLLQEEKIVLATMMKPVYTTGAEDGSALALSTLKSDAVPLANEAIVRALTNEITLINNYTYKLIRDQVKESVVAGESINDLTKRIQSVYKFNKSRARTIARTESMKVVTRSTDAEYNRAGVKKKQWASLSDSRESHLACSAQGAIPYDDVFQNGLMFPGDYGPPEEVINCRCALAPVVE